MKDKIHQNFANFCFSCGTVEVPEGYTNEPDLSKRFPDCCFSLVKITPNSTEGAVIGTTQTPNVSSTEIANTNSTVTNDTTQIGNSNQ